MGYQAPLDGLRAISVIAVMLYHGGFGWMHGGFLGVEVFFVISGYLITVLLIEERRAGGTIALGAFWMRRARRLLPALVAMLVAISTWIALIGSDAQQWQMRRDLPWALGYAANWGQIVGDTPYFEPVDPPLLRHLWSLAVEEQWYVIWPLTFLLVVRAVRMRGGRAALVAGGAVLAGALMWWVQRGAPAAIEAGGLLGWLDGADRVNVNYLSTPTRAFGLLVGAAAAFTWQPWRRDMPVSGAAIDRAAPVAAVLLGGAFVVARLTDSAMYPWGLGGVSLLSLGLVAAAVHPDAVRTRRMLGAPALAAVGRRSYGLYLWHWPVLVLFEATQGSWARYVVAMTVSVAFAEVCYRWIEAPFRERRWTWRTMPLLRPGPALLCTGGVVALVAAFVAVDRYDPAVGGEEVTFEMAEPATPLAPTTSAGGDTPTTLPAAAAPPVTTAPPPAATAAAGGEADTATSTTSTTSTTVALPPAELPVDVAIVGDSQAHSLAINLPSGIEATFDIHNGSVSGCSVFDAGSVVSARQGFSSSFERCDGWQDDWSDAADGVDVALVVIGAWDVFDIESDGATVTFGSAAFDRLFVANLRSGIEAMAAPGTRVGLLEVPCMRPKDVKGAGVPALPERGDDTRVAHLNGLMRAIADADPTRVEFVPGPAAWCTDEAIATDLAYRWDGVHVYRRGAGLIFDTIAPSLLQLAAEAAVEQTG
jgi:peptidoglycan/LPS O-acetylase OafA/YrhL